MSNDPQQTGIQSTPSDSTSPPPQQEKAKGMPLHTKILVGMILGATLGVIVNFIREPLTARLTAAINPQVNGTYIGDMLGVTAETKWDIVDPLLKYVMNPLGKIFLNLLMMTVIPLVFASLATGVARLGDLQKLGRIGVKTLAYFALTMTLAVTIGLVLVNTIRPGEGISKETREGLMKEFGKEAKSRIDKGGPFSIDTFVNIVPRNPFQSAADLDMLGVIFFALVFGGSMTVLAQERAKVMLDFLDALNDIMVVIIGLAMRLAPYGVFAFLFQVTAVFGFSLLVPLGMYVVVVVLGLLLQMFVSFPILVRFLSGIDPVVFFQRVRAVIVTAFSTSSSNATLPTSIKVTEEELGVPPQIAGFVLPLGATMNMNGTALFEGVTVVFLAQVFGVQLDLTQQLVVIIMSVLTSIGAAGVPGGSLPLLASVLTMVGVPPTGLAVILGVDRFLDMCRTTLNVVGDITAATYIAKSEGFELLKKE
jgi:DAACS family dicarboxylate/amino acid:cation (Na+ or H+) symporter